MAGDWIPIDVTLPFKPELARLSFLLRRPIDECVGTLVRFWIWCQAHTSDGHLSGMDIAMIAAASHVSKRFLAGMENVGWLEITETGCTIPNFDRWLSRGAKRRLRETEKKRRYREQLSCPAVVPLLSPCDRDKIGTTEEKRREEKRRNRC